MTNGSNKGILIGIITLICIGLLIAGVLFPVLQKNETSNKPEPNIPIGTQLVTYDDTVVEPGSNKVTGLTNEDWFSEMVKDDKLNFYTDGLGEWDFNSTSDDNRDAEAGGNEYSKDTSATEDDGSKTPSPPTDQNQMPREIEEADIIKLVDDTLYILNTYRGFMIIDVSDPDNPTITSRIPLFGYPVEMYVVEPKAYVILTHYYNTFLWAEDGAAEPEYRHGSEIVIIDISEQDKPKVEQYIELEGFITDTRRVGEVIYAVANNYDYYGNGVKTGVPSDGVMVERFEAGRGEIIDEESKESSEGSDATEEIVISPPEPESEVEPEVDSKENVNEDTENSSNFIDEEYYKEEEEVEETEGTVVVSINFEDLTHVVEVDREWFPGSSNLIHVSEDAIFVAQAKYDYYFDDEMGYKNRYYTKITYVDISDYHGEIKIRDTFEVEGYLEDRYQMDYYDGTFRIVTHFWGQWGELGESQLWIFDTSNPDNIVKTGELLIDDAGNLMATRFAGDRAYTIHLPYSVDPLDVIDLSDPSKPVLTDILEMPGWVTHMEVRGYKILALGVDDSENKQKVAVSLFDVSDPYNAVMQDRVVIGDGYSWSTANWDPKALTVVDDQSLILVPFESYNYDEKGQSKSFSGLQIVAFDLEKGDLTAGGAIEQMGGVQRTRANEQRIFAISYKQLQVIDANNHAKPTITATLELCNNIIDIIPMGDYCVQIISEFDYTTGKSKTMLRTVDSSVPDTSNFVAEKTVDYYINKIYINGNYLYLVCTKYIKDDYIGKGIVLVYDYTDPAKPVKKSEFEMKYYQGNNNGYYYWLYYDWYYWYQPRGSILEYNFALVDGDLLVYHPQPIQYYYSYYVYEDGIYDDTVIEDEKTNTSESRNESEPEKEPTVEKKVPVYYNWNTYNETFYFIDLSDPANPKDVGNITMVNTSRVSGIATRGNALYIIQYKDTSYYDECYYWHYQVKYFLTKVDLNKPSEPKLGEPINIPGAFLGITDDEKTIYTQTSQYDSNNNWKQTLNILELRDGKAVLTSAIELGNDYSSIMVQDSTIIICYNVYNYNYYYEDIYYDAKVVGMDDIEEPVIKTKIQIIDASDPKNLKLQASIGMKNYAYLYAFENDKLFLQLSDSSGLLIYKISNLSEPEFLGYFPTYGYGYVNSIREDIKTSRIFLACGYYGVLLIEI